MSRILNEVDKYNERKRLRNLIADMALNGATEKELAFVVAYTIRFIDGVNQSDKAVAIDNLERKYGNKEYM